MSAQDDLITAAQALRDQGRASFSVADILTTARRYGSTYPDPVLRATMDGMLSTRESAAHDNVVFIEVRHGYYRLSR